MNGGNGNSIRRVQVISDIAHERGRQEILWPGRTCASDTWDDGFRLSVLTEEVGEVASEVCEAKRDQEDRDAQLYMELVQVAAVAIAWCEQLRRRMERNDSEAPDA